MPKPKRLDVEVFNGKVVAVWFGCISLPFDEHECDNQRAIEMIRMTRELNDNIEAGKFDAMDLLTTRLEHRAYSYRYNEDGTQKEVKSYESPSNDLEERQI